MIQIFENIDCLEGMKKYEELLLSRNVLAIVDPPYQNNDAIGILNGNKHSANRKDYKLFNNIKPDESYFNNLKRISKKWIVWGGNYFGLSGGIIAWDKEGTAFGEGEVAICNTHNSVVFYRYRWNGMLQENMKDKEFRIHPTQKPIALYKWLLTKYAKEGDLILDTHVGSASSLIACEDMGFEYIGFELDEDYFNAATKRINQFRSQLKIFEN